MVELLNIGAKAPDFESIDQNGTKVKLSDFKGQPVVVYFYPKDNTPGCTTEACNFRDNIEVFEKSGVKILGISVDSDRAHKKFADKYNLNFTLVADPSKDIARNYGVLGIATAKRVTYIVDKDGKIAHVYQKVTPREHAVEVFEKLKDLNLVP